MKRQRSFKKMLNSRGPNIEPYGIPVVILSHSLNVLFTVTFAFGLLNRSSCISERLFQTHMLNLAINEPWFNVSEAFERPMKIGQIYPPLSKTFFHVSNVQLKQCCVL